MRPGQLTPENRIAARTMRIWSGGFNEAGAINPGKRPRRNSSFAPPQTSFNEAGAINPGKRPPRSGTSTAASRLQ